jgi:serine/threonine protein kinase
VWEDLVGTELDAKYRLLRLLGIGSFGGVFLADEYVAGHLMRRVAVKVIESDRERIARQITELKAAVGLDHPCIVRCYSVGHCPLPLGGGTREALYLVMELGEGSHRDRVHSVPLSTEDAANLASDVASALHYLHGRRLIHRDVKPSNIIRVGNRWKLADLGLVRYLGGEKTIHEPAPGTLYYMPPEALEGEHSSAWDLWALGVTLAEAISGHVPFDATDTAALIRAIERAVPAIPTELPFPLDRILAGCLAKDSGKRMNASQVLDLLEEAGVSAPLPHARTMEVTVGGTGGLGSISEAREKAKPGDRIVLKPGVYTESLVIDRAVELVGDGPIDGIVIDGQGACCALVQAGCAVLRGITFTSVPARGKGSAAAAVQVVRGRCVVEQ